MRPLPANPDLLAVARRTVWFKPPSEALGYPEHLIAHVLTYGMPSDVQILRQYVTDDELREALAAAPAGVFDPRSWAYWNLKMGRDPVPPLPSRRLD
jgi:hypothetical protein